MVTSSGRAYSDATDWVKSSRRRFDKMRYAQRAFGATFLAGLIVTGTIGVLSPAAFGSTGSRTLRTGWPSWLLLGLIGVSVIYAGSKWRYVRWALRRVRDPFVRAPEGDPRYEGAADALAECPAPYRTRFAMWWIWGPVVLALLGGMCAFSVAYFVVDAVLAGFEVGWASPLLAGINLVLGLVLFRLAATRLSTWQMAMAVHRSVTQGY
jgi:hypothetical protein